MCGKIFIVFAIICILVCFVNCRDFIMGMFKVDDRLVAQDRIYKERVPYRRVRATYLKVVRCAMTYLRVADRLGVGGGPFVQIARGGLKKNHIYLYITSSYNQPLSVAIYIGCPKFRPTTEKCPGLKTEVEASPDKAGNDTAAAGGASNGTAEGAASEPSAAPSGA